jgi:hypothetical protein
MGGTDDPSNIIELTVEEHAEAHRKLFEQYGCPEDFAAWKGLSGQMNKGDIIKFLQSEGSKISNLERLATKTHNFLGDNNPSRKKVKLGTHHFQQNVGNRPADITQRSLVASRLHHWQSKKHAEVVGKRSKKLIEEQKHPFGQTVKCPNCGKQGQKSSMNRWHFSNCSSVSS